MLGSMEIHYSTFQDRADAADKSVRAPNEHTNSGEKQKVFRVETRDSRESFAFCTNANEMFSRPAAAARERDRERRL